MTNQPDILFLVETKTSSFCILMHYDDRGDPSSDAGRGPSLDWRVMQCIGRSMPEVYKRLCVCYVEERIATVMTTIMDPASESDQPRSVESKEYRYKVTEMIVETDHKPFKSQANKGIGVAGGEVLPETGIKKVYHGGRETKEEREVSPSPSPSSSFNVQHSTFNVQHSTFNIQHSTLKSLSVFVQAVMYTTPLLNTVILTPSLLIESNRRSE